MTIVQNYHQSLCIPGFIELFIIDQPTKKNQKAKIY